MSHRLEMVLAEKETAEAELVELRARLEGEEERLGREKEALVQQVRREEGRGGEGRGGEGRGGEGRGGGGEGRGRGRGGRGGECSKSMQTAVVL